MKVKSVNKEEEGILGKDLEAGKLYRVVRNTDGPSAGFKVGDLVYKLKFPNNFGSTVDRRYCLLNLNLGKAYTDGSPTFFYVECDKQTEVTLVFNED